VGEYFTAKQVAKYLQEKLLSSIKRQGIVRFQKLKLEESAVLEKILLMFL
jgi:hypothetical protein